MARAIVERPTLACNLGVFLGKINWRQNHFRHCQFGIGHAPERFGEIGIPMPDCALQVDQPKRERGLVLHIETII